MDIVEKKEKLLAAIKEKAELRENILALQREAQKNGWSEEKYCEELLTVIRNGGLEATNEEIRDFVKLTTDAAEGEMKDDELEDVSGGGCGKSCNKWKDCGDGNGRSCYPHC